MQAHRHFHQRAQAPLQAPTVTIVDESVSVPVVEPEVLVYVNAEGRPFSTTTQLVLLLPATPTYNEHTKSTPLPPQDPAEGTSTPPQVEHVAAHEGSGIAQSVPVAVPAAATPESRPPSAPSSSGPGPSPSPHRDAPAPPPHQDEPAPASGLTGVTYSPYHQDGTCKSAGEVLSDFQQLQGSYSLVRLYGVDCDQVASVMPAAAAIGVKLFLGLFNLNSLDADINTMTSSVQAHGGWANIDTVSVGNELVNNGQATPDQMVAAVNSTRASLRGAGYQGPVVTVDTFVAMQQHPVLCDKSDYCAMNVHPFFDPNTPAASAGRFVSAQVAKTAALLANPNQRIVVTETGWPWQGSTNGQAARPCSTSSLTGSGC